MNLPNDNKILRNLLETRQSSLADQGKGIAPEVAHEEIESITIAIPSPQRALFRQTFDAR